MTTIRRQLLWTMLPVFAGLLVVGGVAGYLALRDAVMEANDAVLHARAAAIAAASQLKGDAVVVDATSRVLRDFEAPEAHESPADRRDEGEHDDADMAFFEMWRRDVVMARSPSLQSRDLPRPATSGERPEREGWNVTLPNGQPGRAVGLRFTPRAAGQAAAADADAITLVVAADRHDVDGTLNTAAAIFGAVGGGLLVALAVVVPWVLRRGLAPLDRMATQAACIDAESLSLRFETDVLPGELAPIGSRLNGLLGRLEAAFVRERQFTADVAHELRTPIAELRSNAEVALKWPDARSPSTDRDTLAIARQLEGVVSRLLGLLRAERGTLTATWEPVDLGAEISSACESHAARATDRRIQVERDVPAALAVETDPALLRSILSNLVENAVEYAPAGSTVSIRAWARESRFGVAVANAAGELRATDLPHVFDRFWRRNEARSDGEHSGLGLPIARAFAGVIGCSLEASLTDGVVTFTLER